MLLNFLPNCLGYGMSNEKLLTKPSRASRDKYQTWTRNYRVSLSLLGWSYKQENGSFKGVVPFTLRLTASWQKRTSNMTTFEVVNNPIQSLCSWITMASIILWIIVTKQTWTGILLKFHAITSCSFVPWYYPYYHVLLTATHNIHTDGFIVVAVREVVSTWKV